MSSLKVSIEHIGQKKLYGLLRRSNQKTFAKDVKALSKQYSAVIDIPKKRVFPYFILSKDHSEGRRDFDLLVGSVIDKGVLDSYVLPAAEYAKITVTPKLGFLWSTSVSAAKRYFYEKWLPANPFEALDLEYEYHTERSTGRRPSIDIIFAVHRTNVNSQERIQAVLP